MSNYWVKRFEDEEKRMHELAGDEIRRQQLEYEKAIVKLNRDIEVWYGRVAKNNEVSLVEAKKLLNNKELKEFRWTLEEYIKYGKENGISKDWSRELENASARVHIKRLEAMKLQVRGEIEKLYNNRNVGTEIFLKNIYKDQYYRTAYQIAKGTEVGTNLYRLNDKLVNTVFKKPWTPDGKSFSDRIWEDKHRLINTLHTEMTQAFIRGDSLDRLTNKIAEKMNVSKANAARLVYTESAAYASKARLKTYEDLELEKYEIVATLDNRTSEICRSMDGKIFYLKDYEVGVTAPPFHVRCRTTTAPYFDDGEGERAARNEETGKTEYVPANTTYKEWKKKYVVEENVRTGYNIKEKLDTEQGKVLDNILDNAPVEFKNVWNAYKDEFKIIDFVENLKDGYPHYNDELQGMYITKKDLMGNSTWLKPFEMFFHEAGHQLDHVINLKKLKGFEGYYISDVWRSIKYKNFTLGKMLEVEYRDYIKAIKGDKDLSDLEIFKIIKDKYKNKSANSIKELSDLFSGLSKGSFNLGFGHRRAYWENIPVSKEAFAEFTSSLATNPESLELMKEVFPKSYEIYLEILEYGLLE
ncbi:MAG: minor capsid protein [Bacteroidota bacterium]|nr:minor capsid protein [Bacteroidota bacterium]